MNSSIIVDGNTVENGNYYSAGVNAYTYTTVMLVKGDAIVSNNLFAASCVTGLDIQANCNIIGNSFQNITSGVTSNFIKLTNCASRITDNKFVRGANTVQSYVYITGTSGHTITDNSFDSTTIDGTLETPVVGADQADVTERNRNQIYYKLMELSTFFASTATGYRATTTGLGTYTSVFYNLSGTPVSADIDYAWNLSDQLPIGSRVIGVDWSYNAPSTTGWSTIANSSFTLAIYRSLDLAANITAGTGSIATIITDPGSYMDPTDTTFDQIYINDAGEVATLANGSVKHLKLDLGTSSVWQITPNYEVVLQLVIWPTVLGSSTASLAHALLIKYTYG